MPYIDRPYKGSESERSVLSIQTRDNLLYRLGYAQNAVRFHEQEGNPGQVEFFQSEVNLINRRLKLKRFSA
jgi:hypothetical protein